MSQQQHVAYHHHPPALYPSDDAVLLSRLCAQVDFYFSPQNLAKDTFLSSLLDQNDNAVPLETIASFPKVRELHAIGRLGMTLGMPQSQMPPADATFLAKALEESSVVTVNGQWIHLATSEGGTPTMPTTLYQEEEGATHDAGTRSTPSSPSTTASSHGVPTHPLFLTNNKEQTTLLLYGLLPETTLQTIMNVVSSLQPTHVTRIDDMNGVCWHVVFETHEYAIAALEALQSRTIHGRPIHASLLQGEQVLHPPQQTTTFVPQQHPHYEYYPPQHSVVMPQQGHVAVGIYDPYYHAAVMQQQQQQQQQQLYHGAYHPPAMYAPPASPVYHTPQQQYGGGMPVQYPPQHFPPPPVMASPFPLEVRRPPKNKRHNNYYSNNKKSWRGRGNNAYYNQSRKGNFPAESNESTNAHETNPHVQRRNNTKKPHNKKQSSNTNNNGVLEQDEEFPALVVDNENKPVEPNVFPTAGYAAALKKQPAITNTKVFSTMDARQYNTTTTTTTTADDDDSKHHPQSPSSESATKLEQDFDQLKLSTADTVETEQVEFWEEEDEAPEVW